MTPIMAATLALVMGDETRAAKSLALLAISVLAVIALAAVLSLPYPFIDFEGNGEISSRVAPGLSAMAIALASGAAGAFANSRKEIGDSLPGVAISISLVPPLSVVGIALAHGHYQDALGAFVLFTTNFLAIILAGGVVFLLSGANALTLSAEQAAARKRGYTVAIVSSIVVMVLLGASSFNAYRGFVQHYEEQTAVEERLVGSDYEMVDVVVKYPSVSVTVAGSGELGAEEELALELNNRFNTDVTVQLRKIGRVTELYPDAPPS